MVSVAYQAGVECAGVVLLSRCIFSSSNTIYIFFLANMETDTHISSGSNFWKTFHVTAKRLSFSVFFSRFGPVGLENSFVYFWRHSFALKTCLTRQQQQPQQPSPSNKTTTQNEVCHFVDLLDAAFRHFGKKFQRKVSGWSKIANLRKGILKGVHGGTLQETNISPKNGFFWRWFFFSQGGIC